MSEDAVVFSNVRLCVCLFVCLFGWMSVNTITPELLERSSRNFRASFYDQKGGQVRKWLYWGARVVIKRL